MILTPHVLAGAAIGANVKNPYIVAGLSIIVHFAMDMFPHGDYLNKKSRLREFWKVALDLAFGFALVSWVISFRDIGDPTELRNIFIGVLFSLLPDGTTFLHIWMKMKFLKPVKDFHERLHCFENGSPKREFRLKNNLWDVLTSLICLFALLR